MNDHILFRPMGPAELAGLSSFERSQRAAWWAANDPRRLRTPTRRRSVAGLRGVLIGRLRHPFRTPKAAQPAW